MGRGSTLTRRALFSLIALAHMGPFSAAQNGPTDVLKLHNPARAEVGLGPLQWDASLESYARDYAKVRSDDISLIHSGSPYGENIYWGAGAGFDDAEAAMKYWVNEKNFYDYGSNTCAAGKECLHYTQIV